MRYLNGYYEMARRFVVGKSGKFGKVEVVPEGLLDSQSVRYFLSSQVVAMHTPVAPDAHPAMVVFSPVQFFWRSWTEETEQHMNRILRAMRSTHRVNHKEARAQRVYHFTVNG